jgi:primosomal protein N' (replication factor Y)
VLTALKSASLAVDELRALSPRALKIVREMVAEGYVMECATPEIAGTVQPTLYALNLEQQEALQRVRAAGLGFHPWLLQGVTGSGKTEVYLSLIADALERGGQALMLVPEINLTPQLLRRIAARFPNHPTVSLHSGVPGGERLRNWISAQAGTARIIVGTRLAVFTPIRKLALIIVDEEHDPSFKQQEGLRYSARDLAVFRAKLANCPVILGSATPALESYNKARLGSYRLARLTRRALDAALPTISIVDLTREPPRDGVSQPVFRALSARLNKGEQSLVFINRRGYAPVLWCANCGDAAACPRCSANLVLHTRAHHLRCHHCGHMEKIPQACGRCAGRELLPVGHGTQRIEQTLQNHFPKARILRIDRDSTRAKDAWDDMLNQIHSGDANILVGTQIIAKGHDFPKLTLVAALDADGALYASDFRASERLFAQLMQVAGRAGRAKAPGEVLIQTRFPRHPLFAALKVHDYSAFAEGLLDERKRAGFPPFVHQALLRAEAPQAKPVFAFLSSAASQARALKTTVTIYDPVPAQTARIAGKERGQLLVQSASRPVLQAFLAEWMQQLRTARSSRVRWALDVDPSEF